MNYELVALSREGTCPVCRRGWKITRSTPFQFSFAVSFAAKWDRLAVRANRRRNKLCTQSERRKAPLHSTRLCVHSKTASSWTGGTRELVEPVSYDSFVPTSFRAFESMRPFDRDGSRREPAGGILLYSQTVTFAI